MYNRVVVVGLALLLLLAGCAPAVPVPRAGELLYVTTFDAFNEDWQQYEGRLSAQVTTDGQNAAMQITVDDVREGAFTLLDRMFSDFDLIVEARQTAGPEDLNAPGFGVIFRHQNNDNFYSFLISSDGYYQVSRRRGGVDEALSDWAETPLIHPGQAANTIRVIAQGHTFEFFINDEQVPLCLTLWNPAVPGECIDSEPVMQLVDDTFPPQGRIGLGARSFDQGGVMVAFDNLLVCGPYDDPPIPYRCGALTGDF